MNLSFPSYSFFNRAVCVLYPYVPPVFTQADPDIWPRFPLKLCFFLSFTIQLKPHLNLGKLPCYISIRPASCHFSQCDAPVWLIPDWYEKASSLWFYFHSTSLQISVSAISCWNSPYLSEHCKKCLRTPLKMAEKGWVPASCPGFVLDTPQAFHPSTLGLDDLHVEIGSLSSKFRYLLLSNSNSFSFGLTGFPQKTDERITIAGWAPFSASYYQVFQGHGETKSTLRLKTPELQVIFPWRISLRFYNSGQNTARLQQLREVSCRIQVDFTDDEKIQSCLKTLFSWLLNWEGCSVIFQKVLQLGSWLLKYFRIIFLSANDPLIYVYFPSNTIIVVPGYSKPISLPHPHSPCSTWRCQLCLLGYCKSLLTVLIPFVLTASSQFSP